MKLYALYLTTNHVLEILTYLQRGGTEAQRIANVLEYQLSLNEDQAWCPSADRSDPIMHVIARRVDGEWEMEKKT